MEFFTVYAFSTENWKRPQEEVDAIMKLLEKFLGEALQDMEKTKRIDKEKKKEIQKQNEAVADAYLLKALQEKKVEIRGDEMTQKLVDGSVPATEEDWGTEYLDYKVSIKTVESVEEAISENTQAIAEGVQNWATNEFAPVVEGWVTNEFAPVVEGWVTNEFAPVVEGWVNDEFAPMMEGKVNEKVDSILESQKAGRLDEIDALLESIAESTDVEKIVKEENELSKFKGIYVVEHMPSQYAPSWQMLNEERQNEIIRSSKMYDFTKQGVLESFWAGVDFNNKKEEKQEIVNVVESYHNNVAAQMKRFGKW